MPFGLDSVIQGAFWASVPDIRLYRACAASVPEPLTCHLLFAAYALQDFEYGLVTDGFVVVPLPMER